VISLTLSMLRMPENVGNIAVALQGAGCWHVMRYLFDGRSLTPIAQECLCYADCYLAWWWRSKCSGDPYSRLVCQRFPVREDRDVVASHR
jgi:hypothetical protein